MEDGGEEEADGGKHSNAAVGDLSLAVPLEGIDVLNGIWVVGETSGVEAHIASHCAIKSWGSLVEGKGN